MSKRMTAIIDALRSLPEDAFGYVADTPDQPGWWIRDELIDTACKELDRICGLEAQLARVRSALRMAGRLAIDERWYQRFPKVFGEMEAALQSAAGAGSNQPKVDDTKSES